MEAVSAAMSHDKKFENQLWYLKLNDIGSLSWLWCEVKCADKFEKCGKLTIIEASYFASHILPEKTLYHFLVAYAQIQKEFLPFVPIDLFVWIHFTHIHLITLLVSAKQSVSNIDNLIDFIKVAPEYIDRTHLKGLYQALLNKVRCIVIESTYFHCITKDIDIFFTLSSSVINSQ